MKDNLVNEAVEEAADADAEPAADAPADELSVEEVADTAEAEDLGEPQEAPEEIRRAIEALIMVADRPVTVSLLAQLTEVSAATVAQVCTELADEYAAENRGFVLVNVAGGYRFQTHADLAPYVERFAIEGQSSRLSAAALETLAIIAYKQPLSRGQVSAIRGVNVDAVTRTLQQRGYIAEEAREEGPGQAMLFRTTDVFLERLGLNSLDELPPLGDFVPASDVVEALETSLSAEPIADSPTDAPDPANEVATNDVDVEASVASDLADAPEAEPTVEAETDDAVVIDLRDSLPAGDQD